MQGYAASMSSSFSYETQGPESIVFALEAFAMSQGKSVDFSEQIASGEGGIIEGVLNFPSGQQFLHFLSRNKRIVSYINEDTIYFCLRSEMESTFFSLQGITVAALREKVQSLGLYDKQFPFRAAGSNLFRLTAPTPYVDVISEVIATASLEPKKEKATRVFMLQHAWADDIVIESLNQEVTVAGVATLLREISEGETKTPVMRQPVTSYRKMEGAVAAGTDKNTVITAQNTQEIHGQNANAQSSSGARILADARLNAVIIWDDADRMPFYESLIQALDKAMDLVEIRVAIIDVAVNKSQELGMSWEFASDSSQSFSASGGINTASSFASSSASGLNLSTVYTDGLGSLMAKVSALESRGDAKTLSRPAVLTMDNVQASLENVSSFYVTVNGQEVADLFTVEYGTVLKVTPHIVHDPNAPEDAKKLIKLAVYVESGSSDSEATSEAVTLPTVTKSVINTQAMVAENQALIIGGYYYEKIEDTTSGVPVLMDIPLLGYAFRTESESKNVIERLFVLSPRIVDPRNMATVPDTINTAMHVSEQLNAPNPTIHSGVGCGRKSGQALQTTGITQ